jgi:hypothetical protein
MQLGRLFRFVRLTIQAHASFARPDQAAPGLEVEQDRRPDARNPDLGQGRQTAFPGPNSVPEQSTGDYGGWVVIGLRCAAAGRRTGFTGWSNTYSSHLISMML